MTNEEAQIIIGNIPVCGDECYSIAEYQEAKTMAISALSENKGEWQKISPAGIYECSCCGQNVMTSDIEYYKFCHGCGARMKGGE